MSHRESLARAAHDRRHGRRATPGVWWDEPGTRAIVVHEGQTLVDDDALVTLTRSEVPPRQQEIYLGTVPASPGEPGGDRVGVILDDAGRATLDDALGLAPRSETPVDGASGPSWEGLREIGTRLDDTDVGLITELVALANWHASHRYSPRTGAPTEVTASGWVRRDPESGQEHFPRTDAAIIVAVIHHGDDGEERVLLGRNGMWDPRRYSVLAGFVEPGETLEAAVIREVEEETGVRTAEPVYFGSQPWPFPASLMVGFFAEALSTEISVDEEEILDARWFTRAQFREAVASGVLLVPGEISIAGHLLRAWQEHRNPAPVAQ